MLLDYSRPHMAWFRIALFASLSAALFTVFWQGAGSVDNELFNLYAGARIGPRGLYDPHNFAQVAASLHAKVLEARFYYCRMPYYAVLTKPLGWLPFPAALVLWRAIQAAAIAAAAFLWPGSKSKFALAALVSLPVIWVISFAQDVGLVLLFVAASIALRKHGRTFLAGAVFSLCLGKPHLVILIPLVMLARRDFRYLAGAALGASGQILLSFAVGPPDWPYQWLSILSNAQMHPHIEAMPGLRALTHSKPGTLLAVVIATSLVAAVWRISARQSVERAAAMALAAGVVANLHSYAVDCILLLPAIVIALESRRVLERAAGIFLATPIPFAAMLFGHPAFLQIGVLIVVHRTASWSWVWARTTVPPVPARVHAGGQPDS